MTWFGIMEKLDYALKIFTIYVVAIFLFTVWVAAVAALTVVPMHRNYQQCGSVFLCNGLTQ